jgi:predicted metal-dependent RNase
MMESMCFSVVSIFFFSFEKINSNLKVTITQMTLKVKSTKIFDLFFCMIRFGQALQQPCIVIGGHPSLRCGDLMHLTNVWKDDPKNVIIFIGLYFVCYNTSE